jgi:hypothetical protein
MAVMVWRVAVAAVAVPGARAWLGRDDRAQLIDAGVAARPTVGGAAGGVHACAARLGRDDARVVMR